VFLADEKILYVNDTVTCMIWAFEVNAAARWRRAAFLPADPFGLEPRRSGRHEVATRRATLGHGAGRCLGLCAERQSARKVACRNWSRISPGAGCDFHTLFMTRPIHSMR